MTGLFSGGGGIVAFETNRPAMDLTVLTFNIRYATERDGPDRWELRREQALDLVRAQNCMLVGFQEVLPSQRADLEAGLSDYLWLGRGRDADGGGEQCCLAIDSSFDIIESGTFWLSPEPNLPGSVGWDAAITRICTWARLSKGGLEFCVFNAHWDHIGTVAREESARLLLENALSEPGAVLVMGDFNTTPDSEPLKLLTSGLRDSYQEIQPGSRSATFHGFGKVLDGPRIDYLLTSPDFLVVDCEIIGQDEGPYPSDHFPVFARYELIPASLSQ